MKNCNRWIDMDLTKLSEVFINLSGQVADLVGFLTWDPLSYLEHWLDLD